MFVTSPWRGILPLPDGTVHQADRQVVAFMYSGISALAADATRRRMLFGLGI